MVHAVRAAMQSLKKTGTDFATAQGMDPKEFFGVMGMSFYTFVYVLDFEHSLQGLNEIIDLDAQAGGSAFQKI